MFRLVAVATFSICLLACGTRRPVFDAGVEEDAGMEVDAGRPRGDDPASGWQVAVPLPTGAAVSSRLGVSVTSLGDQFGQPMIAMLYEDPNGDLNYDDNRVVFTRWDGVAKAFTALQTIEVVGGAVTQNPDRQISLARDADTGRIAIAYVKAQNNTVRLAISDDEGAHFSLSTVSDSAVTPFMSNPSVGLAGSTTHVAYVQGNELQYRKSVAGAAFTSPSPLAVTLAQHAALSLGVDSAGNPGVAFFVDVAGTSADLAFWRPGSSAVTVASADMLDLAVESRRPSVSLTFVGTTPHLAFHLQKADAVDATQLWYAKASDAGATWSAPIAIPRNSSSATEFHSTQWYQAISVESTGRVSISAPWSAIGTQVNCNGPKLARAPDGLSFTTCSPAGSPVQRGGDWVSMWSHRVGKQTMVFVYDVSRNNPNLKPGVVMWREP